MFWKHLNNLETILNNVLKLRTNLHLIDDPWRNIASGPRRALEGHVLKLKHILPFLIALEKL